MHNTLALTLDPGANSLSPAAPVPPLPPSSFALTRINVGAQTAAVSSEYRSAVALTSVKSVALSSMALTPINSDASSMTASVNAAPVAMPTVTMPTVNLPPMVNSAMFGSVPLAPRQSTPNTPLAIPLGSLVKPFPMLSYGGFVGAAFFDTRADLATKIKGGIALAAGRNSNKFTPY